MQIKMSFLENFAVVMNAGIRRVDNIVSALDISKSKFLPNSWHPKVNFLDPETLLLDTSCLTLQDLKCKDNHKKSKLYFSFKREFSDISV